MGEFDQPNLVLGTAGHIDHGKSSLVRALTGTDPDRLAEEKKRGITIELGFARLDLGDGRSMGVVDVPGHEKFVRQMIAGSTGIDVALLVIAADDGVMPQTLEHLAVLQTLGVPTCVVALTKIDLCDPEWVELVTEDINSLLSNTPFAGAPIIPCSSRTGEGVEDVRAALAKASMNATALHRSYGMRQPVDRVFSIRGAGTVITGTLWSGTVRPGDTVEMLPQERQCRIRTVQMHDKPVDVAVAGNRVALNLVDVKTDEIRPGDFLATPGLIEPTIRFDTHFTYLDTAKSGKPLESGVRMHVSHGTKEVLGRVLFTDGRVKLSPGESCFAQIRLEEPLPVSLGDRFIVRTYSPVYVAGGGQVLQAHPRNRTNLHEEVSILEALASGDRQEAVRYVLEQRTAPLTAHDLARQFGIDEPAALELLQAEVDAHRGCKVGELWFSTPATVRRSISAIEKELTVFHADNPSKPGLPKEELRQRCLPTMEPACFDEIVSEAVAAKAAVVVGGLVGHPAAQGAAQEAEKAAADALSAALKSYGLTPPSLTELAQEVHVDLALARRALARLRDEGAVYRVSSELFYDGAAVEACKKAIAEVLRNGGEGTIAGMKDAMGGISRKFAVPLLEAFDEEGFTVRDGAVRTLRNG
ncbi:selenocysteine-specific translation elongation factor [Slackia heliotrinireducens]|jgi:selenocysteine-specific elongation factor|uniref:selenocysteine-specific translation elongation factor n=1 Tax=Slackia heliotrinireducens TaxID=84110 RepID=UPI003314F642